ncbi:MAG: type II toxin-antitoxin system prevent-host-death family antitoxin [Anaerolineae bacterium]|nr:type II toxin-antitoxin system prevent-host-death family antitoxin [Anaerolineae bacterium]
MDTTYRAGKTELARNTRQIIRAAQRGQTVVIEHHGQPEVAIIDIVDYRLLRALTHYYSRPPHIVPGNGLSDEVVEAEPDIQAQYDLVLAYFLAEEISLGRAAELLDLPWLDLRGRFLRLDVPMRNGSAGHDEAREEVAGLTAWSSISQ